jgi:hypothetical protein
MGGVSYFATFYSPLVNQRLKLSAKTTEYGTIRNKSLVVIPIAPPEDIKESKSVKTFKVEVGDNFKGHYNTLTSLSMPAFVFAQLHFDKMLLSSRLEQIIKNDEQSLKDHEDIVAALDVKRRNNGGSLSNDDKAALKEAERTVSDAKELIEENVEKLFRAYDEIVAARQAKWNFQVASRCHTECTYAVNEVQVIKEAFKVDAAGAKTEDRFPEKDNELSEDTTADTGWMFTWRWCRVNRSRDAMRGKSLADFRYCRTQHLQQEFGEFGHAEAQYGYMMNNIKIPVGCTVEAFNFMIEHISTIMYLLPSIKDDPNPAYQGGFLDHITRRNKPFAEGEMCQMLMNAMPTKVQEDWRNDNRRQLIPTNREELKKDLQIKLDKFTASRVEKPLNQGGAGGGKSGNGANQKNQGQPGGRHNNHTKNGEKPPCKRCLKGGEKPHVYNRHVTSECKRYDENNQKITQTPPRQVNAHGLEEATPLSKRKRKSSKKKKSKKKKSKRSKKRRRRERSPSTSSSSSSDSSSSSGSDTDSE